MTDREEPDDEDETPIERLLEALRQLAEEGEVTGSGRIERGDSHVDYGYSARTGLGPGASGRKGHPAFERDTSPDTPADTPTDTPPVHVEPDGDDRVVTVDLGGTGATDLDDVDCTITGHRLQVVVDGEPTTAVDLGDEAPWRVGDLTVNNDILQALVTRIEDEDNSE